MESTEGPSLRFDKAPRVETLKTKYRAVTTLYFCWKGKYHLDLHRDCEDWAGIYPYSNTSFTAIVADGVSTQSRSRKGAELACESLGQSFSTPFKEDSTPSQVFAAGRERFLSRCREDSGLAAPPETPLDPAAAADLDLNIYATTALCLWTDGEQYWAACVGDGAIYSIHDQGARARRIAHVDKEGFANEICPLTSENWNKGYANSGEVPMPLGDIEGFCVLTDGLSESIGDANLYFQTIWPELKARLDNPSGMNEYAAAFCEHWEANKFSDDDKALLAVFFSS